MKEFVIPKEPRLLRTMLWPTLLRRDLPSPVHGKPTYYVFLARNALFHGLKALRISPGENVLVPSYHCAAAIEPIRLCGASLKFYNVRRDLSLDFHDIQAKIDKRTRAVLAIHYFGFPQPMRRLQELCKHYHLYLIENCAHVLSGRVDGAALGTFGDISIFSWRKFLPLYDGGQLVINNPELSVDIHWERESLLFDLKVTKNILDKLIDDSSSKSIKALSHLLRGPYGIVRYLMSRTGRQSRINVINNYGLDFDLSVVNFRMSGLSRYILRNLDIHEIVQRRRLNCKDFLKALESVSNITPFVRDLPAMVCPWAFPVLAQERPDLHVALRARGIPAFTWGGVIHPELPIKDFPDAAFLYQHLVMLPIHQSIGKIELQKITDIMVEVIRQKIEETEPSSVVAT